MSNLHIPPHIQSMVDQQDAEMRDLLNAAMKVYREHSNEVHGGEPTPCARSMVMLRHLDGAHQLGRFECNELLAYTVERLVILERELARRIEAAQ